MPSIDPIQDIKERLPIENLIGEYLSLTRAGINLKAVCPFHSEKTPSFMVSPERRTWHCFGCAKGGDVFSFVMEMEGLEFREALEFLAKKTGVELPKNRREQKGASRATRLFAINAAAMEFFEKQLRTDAGVSARKELERRKVDDLTRDQFHIGLALESWDALTTALIKRGYKLDDIIAAGVVVKRQTPQIGAYDRFRNRLMFPLIDVVGRVAGFSARALDPNEKMGKYINSPESEIYHKGSFLFALNAARTEIRKRGFAILVEGQMDAISSHRVGVRNVVATSGTALTSEHLRLLGRYTSNLILAFDVDMAGANATKRGIDLAIASGLNVKVAKMPAGVDPDDLCREDPKAWGRAINECEPIVDYYIRRATSGRDMSRVESKKAVAREVLPEVARLTDPVEQTHYLQQLEKILGVTEQVLRQALDRARTSKTSRGAVPGMGTSASRVGASQASTRGSNDLNGVQKNAKSVAEINAMRRIARLVATCIRYPSISRDKLKVLDILEDVKIRAVVKILRETESTSTTIGKMYELDQAFGRAIDRELFVLEQEEGGQEDVVDPNQEFSHLVQLVATEGLRRELAALHIQAAHAKGADAEKLQGVFVQKTQALAEMVRETEEV